MNEMIERVGRAIAKDQCWPAGTNTELVARAAIEAMRQPTQEMIEAADSEFFEEIWQQMIDAALVTK